MTHPKFNNMLATEWNNQVNLPNALFDLSNYLLEWNKHIFGKLYRKK